jgi:LacI family transcriptional regulator
MAKKVTIYTLSKELDVSPATISKALNNSPELNAQTAAMIRNKAAEYGFKPRPVVTHVKNICALIQTPNALMDCLSPFTVEVIHGMKEYLHSNDLELSLFSDETEKLNSGSLLRQLGRRNIHGAVLINTSKESLFYDELDANRFPYCSLLSNSEKNTRNLLTIDYKDASFRAIEYLIQLGHRKIATIVSPIRSVSSQLKLEGYKKAFQKNGITLDEKLILIPDKIQDEQTPYGLGIGHSNTLELFKNRLDVTALFMMSERIAVGAMHALNQLNLTIPSQVSLLTFDDTPEAPYLNPPLTVMRIPNRKLGYAAARWVHQMILGQNKQKNIHEPWMRGELVIRDSTAPARK